MAAASWAVQSWQSVGLMVKGCPAGGGPAGRGVGLGVAVGGKGAEGVERQAGAPARVGVGASCSCESCEELALVRVAINAAELAAAEDYKLGLHGLGAGCGGFVRGDNLGGQFVPGAVGGVGE